MLGFTDPPVIVDHPGLQDSMANNWNVETIADEIKVYLRAYKIDLIVSFDEWGISYHPNHIAVHNACKELVLDDTDEYIVDLMTLTTVNRFRKFIGFADIQFGEGD